LRRPAEAHEKECLGSTEWELWKTALLFIHWQLKNETKEECGRLGREELLLYTISASLLPLPNSFTLLRTSSLKYISFHSCIMVPQNPGNPI
jgi:hypothetical protein